MSSLMFRAAESSDLPALREMYRAVVDRMRADGLDIWDDVYPVCALEGDIRNGVLYILLDGSSLAAAFALCRDADGAAAVQWIGQGSALYLDRLAVSPVYAGQGIGSRMLTLARQTAQAQGAQQLRLFVVQENRPAIRLYEKNGFLRAGGVYQEVIDDTLTLCEYGYETPL